MLHFVIVASNVRDIAPEVGARPLNARSLALSALLGTHPPRLSAHGLVALAEAFGISAGAMRTALSRLAAVGDVVNDGGTYSLTERLAARQAAQDAGRRPPATWDGRWRTAVAAADQRDLADRRRIRSVFADARFGELRPDTWLRPANLAAPALGDDWIVTTGELSGVTADELVRRLWDLDALAADARSLLAALDVARDALDGSDPAAIPAAFEVSARVVRFLRSEPLLPCELVPDSWPIAELRRRYDGVEAALQERLRPILLGDG